MSSDEFGSQVNEIVRRRGRPNVAPDDRRRAISISLSPEIYEMGRDDADSENITLSAHISNLLKAEHIKRRQQPPAILIREVMNHIYESFGVAQTSMAADGLSATVNGSEFMALLQTAIDTDGVPHASITFIKNGWKSPGMASLDPFALDVSGFSSRHIANLMLHGPGS